MIYVAGLFEFLVSGNLLNLDGRRCSNSNVIEYRGQMVYSLLLEMAIASHFHASYQRIPEICLL